jgi:hypothetical protein
VTVQEALKQELRTVVGPFLRSQGFRGSGTTWRLWSERGDCSIVNVQSSQFSSSSDVSCVINLSIVPAIQFDWWEYSSAAAVSRRNAPTEALGMWRERLHPTGPGQAQWWRIASEEQAHLAALDMVDQLSALGIPTLAALQDRRRLLQSFCEHSMPGFGYVAETRHAIALLLCDEGESEELRDALEQLLSSAWAEAGDVKFAKWATEHARAISGHRQTSL